MFWLWLALSLVGGVALICGLLLAGLYYHLCTRYLDFIVRVLEEKPLFVVPSGAARDDAEDLRFPTEDGLHLKGCYLRTNAPARKGVILFGLEYGSKRFACIPYGQSLLDAGYDVFSFETRSQGESDVQPNYRPLHWVTNYEVADYRAAVNYLKQRPDADPKGVGFFGISKGACAGLIAGSQEPYVRCFVTDGVFGTRTTMLPYMRKWVTIVSTRYWLQKVLPLWFYGLVADRALRRISDLRSCVFPHLERAMPRLAPRPLLMIQGGGDTYIKPEMARSLFKLTREPKELWVVQGAKHNQSFQVAGAEYASRLTRFFDDHLGDACSGDSFRVDESHKDHKAPMKFAQRKSLSAKKAELMASPAVAVEHA